MSNKNKEKAISEIALAVQKKLKESMKVDFWNDESVQRKTKSDIDDLLYDIEKEYEISLSPDQKDEIIEKTMKVAKNRKIQ